MRLLIIAQQPRKFLSSPLYEGIAAHAEHCDIRYLTRAETLDLHSYFRHHVDLDRYDRVVLALRLKRAQAQIGFIRTLPHLAFHETDAFQNYIACKYTGQYSRYYSKLPWARIISTGCGVARRLREEGFDAVFVSKGYDAANCRDLNRNNSDHVRPIELGFIGSLTSTIYAGRRAFIEQVQQREMLQVMQTLPGSDYVAKLNDIRFFVSPDAGMGEYMIKNFEAMACGCTLLAFDQGAEENAALGFVDMENIVLFRNVDEFCAKLAQLRAHPAQAAAIAAGGRTLAETRYRFDRLGAQIVAELEPPLRPRPAKRQITHEWRKRLQRVLEMLSGVR